MQLWFIHRVNRINAEGNLPGGKPQETDRVLANFPQMVLLHSTTADAQHPEIVEVFVIQTAAYLRTKGLVHVPVEDNFHLVSDDPLHDRLRVQGHAVGPCPRHGSERASAAYIQATSTGRSLHSQGAAQAKTPGAPFA